MKKISEEDKIKNLNDLKDKVGRLGMESFLILKLCKKELSKQEIKMYKKLFKVSDKFINVMNDIISYKEKIIKGE